MKLLSWSYCAAVAVCCLVGCSSSESSGEETTEEVVTCLESSAHENWFLLSNENYCVTEAYDSDGYGNAYQLPTWGRHGGPLAVTQNATTGNISLHRFYLPSDSSSTMTSTEEEIAITLDATSFLGAQALDTPFGESTVISSIGSYPNTEGKLMVLTAGEVSYETAVNGFYLGAVTGNSESGRLFYSGFSGLGNSEAVSNSIWAADACVNDSIEFASTGGDCGESVEVSSWGDASGPVVADSAGNVFAALSTIGVDQQIRGFTAESMQPGSGSNEGQPLATLGGFGSSLTAIAPTETSDGLLVYQPWDGTTYVPLDVVAMSYSDESEITSTQSEPTQFLEIQNESALSLFVDEEDHLWVGTESGEHYFVIQLNPEK